MDIAEALSTIAKARQALRLLDGAEKALSMVNQSQRIVEETKAELVRVEADIAAARASYVDIQRQISGVAEELAKEKASLAKLRESIAALLH